MLRRVPVQILAAGDYDDDNDNAAANDDSDAVAHADKNYDDRGDNYANENDVISATSSAGADSSSW
jgi:hypothetical protein